MTSQFFLGAPSSTPSTVSAYDSGPVSPTTPIPHQSHLQLPSDPDSDSDADADLPFPQPLSRAAFSPHTAPTFSPTAFLASLRNRHQTLEDLRLELRNQSRDLERELVELVNADYADFVGLGRSLGGGEGKVEDLRVGLWQFRREVEGLIGRLKAVEGDVKTEVEKRRKVRGEQNFVRRLLAIAQRLDELEMLLLLDAEDHPGTVAESGGGGSFAMTDLIAATDDGGGLSSLPRLERLVDAYLCLQHALAKLPPGSRDTHPFLKTQAHRVERVRKTLLLDLGTALRSAAAAGAGAGEVLEVPGLVLEGEKKRNRDRLMGVMGLFLAVGEGGEAVRILKEGTGGKGGGGGGAGVRGGGSISTKTGSLRMKMRG